MTLTMKIHTAPSGALYVSLPYQSPDLCDLCDQHGVRGYRSDYRDLTTPTAGMGGWCLFGENREAAERFAAAAAPLVAAARQEYEQEQEYERAEIERQDRDYAAAMEAWHARYPHGRRVHFQSWGTGAPGDGYAIERDAEGAVRAVVRSLERRTGLSVCAGPRSEGTALEQGEPSENHYAVTLGRPCRGGGWTPEAEVWFSIPVGGMA